MNNTGPAEVSWPHGYVLEEGFVQHLEGRLLTIIESLGLKDIQEKAAKDLVRSEVRRIYLDGLYVTSEQHTKLREENRGFGQTRSSA